MLPLTLKTGTHAWRTVDLDDLTVAVLRRHLANQEFERRARPSVVSKVRGFLGSDPGARDAAVVRPAVDTGTAAREPAVSSPRSVERSQADGRA